MSLGPPKLATEVLKTSLALWNPDVEKTNFSRYRGSQSGSSSSPASRTRGKASPVLRSTQSYPTTSSPLKNRFVIIPATVTFERAISASSRQVVVFPLPMGPYTMITRDILGLPTTISRRHRC